MAQFDMKKLSTGDKGVVGAGVVALIALFLPWEGVTVGPYSVSVSGFSSGFGWVGALLIIAAAVYVVLVRSGSNVPKLSYGPGVLVLGASAIGTLLVLLRWLTLSNGVGPRIGLWLTVIAGLVQVFFALGLFRSTGETLPWASKPTKGPSGG